MFKHFSKFMAQSLVVILILVSTTPALNQNIKSNDLGLIHPVELCIPGCQLSISSIYYYRVHDMTQQMSLGISVWVVKDIDAFASREFFDNFGLSNLDRALDIDILYEEWSSLLFGVLKADPEQYREWAQKWNSGKSEEFQVPGYPMLSQLNDNFVDISYTSDEVHALRQEAEGLIAKTDMYNQSNKPALSLLRKILTICDEAQKQNLSIYLVSP